MSLLSHFRDKPNEGLHYTERMHRILGVCHSCGILWHEEKTTYRNGLTELHKVEDIKPEPQVLVTSQYEKYGLRVNPRILPRLHGMAPQFAYALNVPAVRVETAGDVVYVRVPREAQGDGVFYFETAWALSPDIPAGSLLLGVDEEQGQFVLDLVAPTATHAMVIGMTGSGKSTQMKTMILSAQMSGAAQVALLDPSGGFLPVSGHPSVWRGGLFRRPADCQAGLEILARSLGQDRRGIIYCFVDEVPELIRQRPAIRDYLASLAQMGRHAGVHLVLGAQHPLSSELGPATMRNIPVRLVGRVADKGAAYNATGRNDTGAELLRGAGDFIAVNGSRSVHYQAAMPSEQLLAQWAQRYPPREPRMITSRSALLPGRAGEPPSPGPRQSTAAPSPTAGRPFDDLPPAMTAWIQSAHEAMQPRSPTRLRPSLNEIAAQARVLCPEGELWGREKARSARALALGDQAEPEDHQALARRKEPHG